MEGESRVVGEESKAQQLTGTEGKMWGRDNKFVLGKKSHVFILGG